jgi:hypothetical protein
MKQSIRFSYEEKLFDLIGRRFGELPTWKEFGYGKDLVEHQKRISLSDAILVTSDLLPNVFNAYQLCLDVVGSDMGGDLFIRQSQDMNASVCAYEGRFNMIVHSSLIEKLSLNELRFVFGHELGHVVLGHSAYPLKGIVEAVSDMHEDAAKLLLRFACACEISADRVGLLCCESMINSVSALFSITSGLTGIDEDRILRSFRNQYEVLLTHIDEFKGANVLGRTHPMIPIRFKALELSALDILSLRLRPGDFSWRNFETFDRQIANLIESIDIKGQ